MTRTSNSSEPVSDDNVPIHRLAAVPTPSGTISFLKKKRRMDLATLMDIRREMSRVYRDVHFEKLRPEDGAKRVYMLATIAKVVEQAEVQPRVEAIERAVRSERHASK